MKKSKRRILREKSLQILYAHEMQGENLEIIIDEMLSDVKVEQDREFSRNLVYKVLAERSELDKVIRKRVANWEMDRIALIDRILLRIGIAELLYFPDIPPKVTINEVIEIAKDFSTSKSGKFINGILDALLKEFKISGSMNKKGRGLVEESFTSKPSKN